MNLHPYIHCVVTAGAMDANGNWKDAENFLLTARVVHLLCQGRFRAAIQQALNNDELRLPSDHSKVKVARLLRQAGSKIWCVKIEEQYAHGRGVMLNLCRYLRGGLIHPKQIVLCDNECIGFRYKGHRD